MPGDVGWVQPLTVTAFMGLRAAEVQHHFAVALQKLISVSYMEADSLPTISVELGFEEQRLARLLRGHYRMGLRGGTVGDNWISLDPDSATYEVDGTTWTSTSSDDRGSLDVSLEGASGTLKMYEQGTAANNSDDQVFVDLVVNITCPDQS